MDHFHTAEFPRLLDLIYDAAIDVSRWQAFLDALSSPFGGANGILFEFDRVSGSTNFSFGFGNDPAFIPSYPEHFQHVNPYRFASAKAPLGVVCMTSLILDIESASKSEFYNDWMRPQGIPPDNFGLLLQQARLVSALAAGHSIGDVAERVGLSQNTVRNQLAAAFAKTQTSRPAELVALVIRRLKWRRIGGQIR